MQQINCYLPIKLRITGRLSDAQLDQLTEAIVRALAARISFAQRTIAAHTDTWRSSGAELVRDDYDPSRTDAMTDTYRIPSYQGPGKGETRRVPLRGRSRRSSLPWLVRKAIAFHARVGRFLDYIESLRPGEELGWKVLYGDLWEEVRWVSVWLVQVNQPYLSSELAPIVEKRAVELSRLGHKEVLAYGHSHHEAYRKRLIAIDEEGIVAREIPDMSRNLKFTEKEEKGDTKLHRGAWLLVTTMVLPKIRLEDLVVLAPEIQAAVRLRELTFLISTDAFRQAHGLSWEAYIQESGNDIETLRLQPVTIKRRIHVSTLQYLVGQAVNPRVQDELSVPGATFVGRLQVLNRATLDQLPSAMREPASAFSNDLTLGLNEAQTHGAWEPDWRGVYLYTVLIHSEDDLGAARLRPSARLLLPALLTMLLGDPRDSRWVWALVSFLEKNFGYGPETRPPGGTLFEFVLEGLEKAGSFNGLFDQIESADHVPLHQQLIRLALATRYAGHERVRSSHELLSARVLSRRKNIYYEQEIWLDRDSGQIVKVGQAFGDINTAFIVERDDRRMKPARLPAFREALEKERKALIGRIARGEDANQYEEGSFASTVIALAAQRIQLTDNDFEKVTIQRSLRLLRVEFQMKQALPRYDVTFEFVERVKGEAWQSVSGPITWSEDDFEGRLILWRLGRAGEFLEMVGTGVLVVGVVAIAWEAGIIAALVKAAGGGAVVGFSIVIAEVLYLIRVVFGDAKLTLRGFLEAALDGYLMALGFRGAGFLGRGAAQKIGTESLKRLIGGWIAERLVTGTVGGAGSGALTSFSHDLIDIAIEGRDWSGIETYVTHMAWGALLGIAFEFLGAPILRWVGEKTLRTLGQVVGRARAEGLTGGRWTALMTKALGHLHAKLSTIMTEAAALRFKSAMAERLLQVAEQLAPQRRAVFRRALELSPGTLSPRAVEGLEKFLSLPPADLSDEAALALLNRLKPGELPRFLETLSTLESSEISALARAGRLEALAAAPQPALLPEPSPAQPPAAEAAAAQPPPAEAGPPQAPPAEPAPAQPAPPQPEPEPAAGAVAAEAADVLSRLPLKTREIYMYLRRPMVITENAEIGTQAMFKSTGESNPAAPRTEPGPGDWPLCYGVAKTKTITWHEYYANNRDPEALVQIARSKSGPVEEWVIKSKSKSRWGKPHEAPTVREISALLNRTLTNTQIREIGREVSDVEFLNAWLKRNGVKVGGDFKLGDPAFTGRIGAPVPIIIEIPSQ